MESPDSPYASSPEGPRRSGRPRSPGTDDKDKGTYVRLLVSNTAAGCIIGKGGSTITEFQSQSGARIQLSRNNEFFPGTSDRIILISGGIDEIIKAMELIQGKLLAEADDNSDVPPQRRESSDAENRSRIRLIVPNGCCGGIIGKGGVTIKSFIDESQASIKISPQDQSYPGVNDRVVTLTGSLEEQMRAVVLILSKLNEDSHYSHTVNSPYPYAGVNFPGVHGIPVSYAIPSQAYNTMGYGTNGAGGKFSNAKPRGSNGAQEGPWNSVTIGVADEHIGAVLGRAGRNIMEITQRKKSVISAQQVVQFARDEVSALQIDEENHFIVGLDGGLRYNLCLYVTEFEPYAFIRSSLLEASGARVKVSDRGDFMTGTSDRKVTITGPPEAIRAAEDMIMRKISVNHDSP